MFDDCVGNYKTSYGSCKFLKMSSYGYNTPLWWVLTKKWQSGRITRRKVYFLFGGTRGTRLQEGCVLKKLRLQVVKRFRKKVQP